MTEIDEFQKKRAEVVQLMAGKMAGMDTQALAARVVGMLIHDEGNLNKYQATLELVLEAHSIAISSHPAPEATPAAGGITLWLPEPDLILHQKLGKLAEELGELQQIVARCLIQGYHETEPVSGKANSVAMAEEVDDVRAAIRWLYGIRDLAAQGISGREARKFAGFERWEAMLRETLA